MQVVEDSQKVVSDDVNVDFVAPRFWLLQRGRTNFRRSMLCKPLLLLPPLELGFLMLLLLVLQGIEGNFQQV